MQGGAQVRHRGQQLPGVRLLSPMENTLGITLLNDLTVLHHHDPVGHIGHHAHIVGDQDDAGVDTMAQITHEIQYFGLHGHIESGGRLIGDEQPGI
ncbi:Uncharacterised protein [Mycobacteroides abscessus subsp. abscessus]|nr:Uncharacterised protein [Mycobacteroides abscessus subsp. abscessus]